ncbi:proteasome assembly chaperone family protein [Candidatus Micrarchaeota archaeon]|nr:proteasome assembly chaperone family protein [Candidatus Micrarchaeota archaeon]
MSDVEIHRTADFKKLKAPTMVIGFPGTGLVGSVAAAQIVDALQMTFGGYLSSSDFAPLAAIHNYKPMPAARIHYSDKYNLVVVVSEMTIPVASSLEVADKLYGFARSINASSIISLGGISLKEEKEEKGEVYFVSSDSNTISETIAKKIAKPIREGATTGVTGILLTKGTLEKFPVTTIMAESSADYLDPKAAATVIRTLTKMTGIQINTNSLDKEAVELSKGLKEAIIKARETRKKGPAGEEGGSMYG